MYLSEKNKELRNHNPAFPVTTLFLVQSIDGKITTGVGIDRDFDTDIVAHDDLKQGMEDYYEIERNTDLYSCISGKIAAKLGANEGLFLKEQKPCCFVVFDNSHLTHEGRLHIANNCKQVIFVTKNNIREGLLPSNVKTLMYGDFNPVGIFRELKSQFNIRSMTIQTGGELNSVWFSYDLIDYIKVVIAPIIVGGCYTTTLVDGKNSLMDSEYGPKMFSKFKLSDITKLRDGFVCMDYVRVRQMQERMYPANDAISKLIESAGIY